VSHNNNHSIHISMQNFSLWGGSGWVLQNVSLEVAPGSFCVLLGPNGAGKSSLLKSIGGVLQPPWEQFGRLRFDCPLGKGRDVQGGRPVVSWLSQSLSFFEDLSVREFLNLSALAQLEGFEHNGALLSAVMTFGVNALLEHRLSALSGGQWQRVRLARALGQDASVFLLDEPDAALDRAWRRVLWRALVHRQSRGATVIVALHRFSEVRDFVGFWFGLEQGRLVFTEGRPETFPQIFVDRLFLEKGLTR
jgi:ABC-type Mn2+/Zn2+ transport system ATPase subunit